MVTVQFPRCPVLAEWSRSYKLSGHRSWSRLIELSQRLLGTGCTDVTKRLVISALIGCNFNKRVPLGAIAVCQCLLREKGLVMRLAGKITFHWNLLNIYFHFRRMIKLFWYYKRRTSFRPQTRAWMILFAVTHTLPTFKSRLLYVLTTK